MRLRWSADLAQRMVEGDTNVQKMEGGDGDDLRLDESESDLVNTVLDCRHLQDRPRKHVHSIQPN